MDILSYSLCLLYDSLFFHMPDYFSHPHNYIYVYIYVYTHIYTYVLICASLIAQLVKNLPAMQETQVRFLGWDDPLENG